MGTKGDKQTSAGLDAAEAFISRLDGIEGLTSKKMFGGVGIFHDGTMFVIVSSAGDLFLRAGDDDRALFDEAGSKRHGKMPYYSIPDAVMTDATQLEEWVQRSIAVAHNAKK